MVFANCAEVVQSMSEFCSDIRLVPNGCDDQPIKYNLVSQRAFDDCAARRKCILFAGNLEKKIDIALLEKVALRFSECDIVLIGSTHANPDILSLKRYKNINFVGVVPYSEIGKWLSDADVGIIPHLNISLTKNMNPLKLYVYLSWGIPVVSTEVYNIDTVSGFVKVARSHDEFLHFVEITLNCSRPDTDLIRSYVYANSWSARFSSHIDALLDGQCPSGNGTTLTGRRGNVSCGTALSGFACGINPGRTGERGRSRIWFGLRLGHYGPIYLIAVFNAAKRDALPPAHNASPTNFTCHYAMVCLTFSYRATTVTLEPQPSNSVSFALNDQDLWHGWNEATRCGKLTSAVANGRSLKPRAKLRNKIQETRRHGEHWLCGR